MKKEGISGLGVISDAIHQQVKEQSKLGEEFRKLISNIPEVEIPVSLQQFLDAYARHNLIMRRSFGYPWRSIDSVQENVEELKQLRMEMQRFISN